MVSDSNLTYSIIMTMSVKNCHYYLSKPAVHELFYKLLTIVLLDPYIVSLVLKTHICNFMKKCHEGPIWQ